MTVGHLPPGTSKWNTIEHRLFSCITQNWRGKPLITHQVTMSLIAATTTKTGVSESRNEEFGSRSFQIALTPVGV